MSKKQNLTFYTTVGSVPSFCFCHIAFAAQDCDKNYNRIWNLIRLCLKVLLSVFSSQALC